MRQAESGYLPSLDGWRALAIGAVLLVHDQPIMHFRINYLQSRGAAGVYLFFALSGILVTWRILKEEESTGLDLRSFYIRRLFRIQPAALCYLAAIVILNLLSITHERWRFILGALLSYRNFQMHVSDPLGPGWLTGHFWTLAVEEHFYIFLSLFLFAFRRHRITILSTLIVILVGVQFWVRSTGGSEETSVRTYWMVQYLLFASLLSLLLRLPPAITAVRRYLQPHIAFGLTGFTGIMAFLLSGRRDLSIQNVLNRDHLLYYFFAIWIIATMLHPQSLTTRLLELAPMRFIGRLSYSIYLWHKLFFTAVVPDLGVTWKPLLTAEARPLRYITTLVAAYLSYRFLERPLIRVGHRLASSTGELVPAATSTAPRTYRHV